MSQFQTCIHEAAHCLVAQYFNLAVEDIWVNEDGSGGCTYYGVYNDFVSACISYAGYYAEKCLGNEITFSDAEFDDDRSDFFSCGYSYKEIEDALSIIFESEWKHLTNLAISLA